MRRFCPGKWGGYSPLKEEELDWELQERMREEAQRLGEEKRKAQERKEEEDRRKEEEDRRRKEEEEALEAQKRVWKKLADEAEIRRRRST